MSTVDKAIAEAVMNGKYAEDRPVKVVRYDNQWGGESYGIVFKGQDLNRFEHSPACHNVKTLWLVNVGRLA